MTSYILEVYYRPPADTARESRLTCDVAGFGGTLVFCEHPHPGGLGGCCLTYQFGEEEPAEATASALRARGEHVEGPYPYF